MASVVPKSGIGLGFHVEPLLCFQQLVEKQRTYSSDEKWPIHSWSPSFRSLKLGFLKLMVSLASITRLDNQRSSRCKFPTVSSALG